MQVPNHLGEAIPVSSYKICFGEKTTKITLNNHLGNQGGLGLELCSYNLSSQSGG